MTISVFLILIAEALCAMGLLYASGVLKNARAWLIAVALTALAFALRGALLSYETLDYQDFLAVWVDWFRANGGVQALGMPVGNYNVPYLTLLALFSGAGLRDLYWIKLISVFFDIVLAFSAMQLVGRFTDRAWRKLLAFFLVLFWPTVVLNGSLWGQCDSIYSALLLLGLWLILADRPWAGVAAMGAAFAFKLQAVFLLPMLLLFWIAGKLKWYHLAAFPLVNLVLVLPAVLAGRGLFDALTVGFQQTGSIGDALNYNSPSVFAFFRYIQNAQAASRVGIVAAALVLVLLALVVWYYRRSLNDRVLLLCAVIMSIAVPFFLPHMHDRYFFCADMMTLVLACTELWLAPIALGCEYASLLGYHAYLKMRYLHTMDRGALVLILALGWLAILLIQELKRCGGSAPPSADAAR
ncbi:MAG: DUF2029 domain-containing protein [Pyramidobacter sp.]|nr:DUF2029 domain-containing protein [Pyramidobacter sp.]